MPVKVIAKVIVGVMGIDMPAAHDTDDNLRDNLGGHRCHFPFCTYIHVSNLIGNMPDF